MIRMFSTYGAVAASTMIASAVLTSCGPFDAQAAPTRHPQRVAQQAHEQFGRVTAIQPITTSAKPTGAGAVLGGVVGGVLGHQVGSGSGRSAATAVGAVGGALVGHELEKERAAKTTSYRVTVRGEDGRTHVFEADRLEGMKVGDRVRIDGGLLRRV